MVTLSLSCRQRSGSITPLAEIPRRVGGKLGGRRGTMKERERKRVGGRRRRSQRKRALSICQVRRKCSKSGIFLCHDVCVVKRVPQPNQGPAENKYLLFFPSEIPGKHYLFSILSSTLKAVIPRLHQYRLTQQREDRIHLLSTESRILQRQSKN